MFAAFAAGARGYLLKEVTGPQLLEAVHALHRGEGFVSPGLAAAMLIKTSLLHSSNKGPSTSRLTQLTYREGQIFELLPTGLTNREIGGRLGMTEKTIKRYLTHIFEKLHVRNRVEAAMLSRLELKAEPLQKGRQIISLLDPSTRPSRLADGRRQDKAAARGGIVGVSAAILNGASAVRLDWLELLISAC
jgi:DNA-binding CsgD family transcriptional regulator